MADLSKAPSGPGLRRSFFFSALLLIFLSCYGANNTALPGSQYLWFAAEDNALVSFSRWDSLEVKSFGFRYQTPHVSSLAVVEQELEVIISPWGKVSLRNVLDWSSQGFAPSPGLPGQQLGEYWIDSQGRFLHIFFEPGLSPREEGQEFPLEIVKDNGLIGGWELLPFRFPPGEEGWQIVQLFRKSENQYLVVIKRVAGNAEYKQMLWNSGTDNPEFLETEEDFTELVKAYPELEVLPSLVTETHGHILRRTGAEFPVVFSLGNKQAGLAYEFSDGLNRGVLAENGDFYYQVGDLWERITLPMVPNLRYHRPVFWNDRWVFAWERSQGPLLGHSGVLVFLP